jgi:hypothetical protein
MTIDVDATIVEVHGYHKQGASYGYTRTLGDHPLLATRAATGEVLLGGAGRCRRGGPGRLGSGMMARQARASTVVMRL